MIHTPKTALEPITPGNFRCGFRVGGSHRRRGLFWSATSHAMSIERIMFTLTLVLFGAGCIDRIPPSSLTETRMFVTKRRILQYAHTHDQLPPNLASLPPMPGYDTSVTDGWGRALVYRTNTAGVVTLESLGRDGISGGSGDDADIIRSFPIRNSHGAWSDEMIDWSK